MTLRLLELPLSSTHWTQSCCTLLRSNPFENTMHMKGVITLTPNNWTVISRCFAIWTASVELHVANTTGIVIYVPFPCGNAVPAFHINLHVSGAAFAKVHTAYMVD
eukprot:TRINITY_DN13529_c0_g1_i1.p2 TRINITY_DN13529_c0_g1~~TRINITY_DN13529_c0_g1_i1.p2  ORF type:complete len:106 (-),score=2.89 TRINITY_DN13529_c0_g1_i1:9-326(-)